MKSPVIKVHIVDDEPDSCNGLKSLLELYTDIKVLSISNSPKEGLRAVLGSPPDILFLDIQMPQMDGIEFLKRIAPLLKQLSVVVISAHKDYAIAALQESAFDYILKPVGNEDIERVLMKYHSRVSETNNNPKMPENHQYQSKFIIRTNDGMEIINLPDIIYVEADKNYSYFYLSSGQRKISCYNIGKLEKQLYNACFKRISRKHIINLARLDSIDGRKKVCIMKAGPKVISLKYSVSLFEVVDLMANNFPLYKIQ
ncbi:MAG: response regulator transcription factor [Chlorobi bacterium]|nr:response regulator transcription factor [Chlorobiota bacterium]